MEVLNMNIPVLALRGLTVFPKNTVTVDVERPFSIYALNAAMQADERVFLVTQKDISTENPDANDLYEIGTICKIQHLIKTGEKSLRIIVEGETRAKLHRMWQIDPFLQANIEIINEKEYKNCQRGEALIRQTYALFGEYKDILGNIPDSIESKVLDIKDTGVLADFLAQNMTLRHEDRQHILETLNPMDRLDEMNTIIAHEIEVISLEVDIEQKVRQRIAGIQKNTILREQMKILKHELGEDTNDDIAEYAEKIKAAKLSEEIEEKLNKELSRLEKQPFGSSEASVIRNYLDVCLDMPWNNQTKDCADVAKAKKTLDKDHFGLEKVKESILEYIAVRQINPESKGKVICLVGPPGVGKTSIAISIAKAMNRKMSRLSLGGVRDEADIRGHRKTYVGAMPGRIIEAMIRSKSMNPLLVLDEIDKLGQDMRGDPASALLEVFDAEQNYAFRDHFLEIPVDLSQVVFITTANTTNTIPRPLLDRMEVIELSSYTDEEKVQIAKKYLVPKQLKEHGLQKKQLSISENAIRKIIESYTRESGVRKLESSIEKICRKTAMKLVSATDEPVKRITITDKNIKEYLGIERYTESLHLEKNEVGVVNGLAWTQVGGEILEVEANVVPGTGKLELTGNLGNVMQESVKAAISCLRSRVEQLKLPQDFYKNYDIHIHFPEGAVPKDGPSAGIAIATCLVSALTNREVRGDVAMTGEITIRGRVLPIGGLKEKTMAAYRNGIKTVIIPKANLKDLEEIDQTVRAGLRFIAVEKVDQVLASALMPMQTEDIVEQLSLISSAVTEEVYCGNQL